MGRFTSESLEVYPHEPRLIEGDRPIEAVEGIFNAMRGIQPVRYSRPPEDGGDYVLGYYYCDNPPSFGFSIPSRRAASGMERTGTATSPQGTIFNVARSVTARPSNSTLANNCTLNMVGTNSLPVSGFWLVGQCKSSVFGIPGPS